MRILVPLAGLIDVDKERERLDKQLVKVRADLEKCRQKLKNSNFVDNAPDDVVAKERARSDELSLRSTQLEEQLKRLQKLG
jgi:valyl-tRNA synthetase